MSNFTALFGGGTTPVGAIVQGMLSSDPTYLPCSGSTYLKSAYPAIDSTFMPADPLPAATVSTGSVGVATYSDICSNGTLMIASLAGSTTYYTSTDGTTWTSRTAPFSVQYVAYVNGKFFLLSYQTIAYGIDGINWTNISSTLMSAWPTCDVTFNNVGYVAGLYLFYGMTNSAATSVQYATTANLSTFTVRAFPTTSWQPSGSYYRINMQTISSNWGCSHPVYGYVMPNGFWWGGSNYASSNNLMYTLDGINWNIISTVWSDGATGNMVPVSIRVLPDNQFLIGVVSGSTGQGGLIKSPDLSTQVPLLVNTKYNSSLSSVEVFGSTIVLAPRQYATIAVSGFYPVYSTDGGYSWKYSTGFGSSSLTSKPVFLNNGSFFLFMNISANSSNVAGLNIVDTTKFKTPLIKPMGTTDQFYIKAKLA